MTKQQWEECCHHHQGCSCHEHKWEMKVAALEHELKYVKFNYDYLVKDWNNLKKENEMLLAKLQKE